MKKIIIVMSSLIIMSIGSFIGTLCHTPDMVQAQDIQYIPIPTQSIDTTLNQYKLADNEQQKKASVNQEPKYITRYIKVVDKESKKQLKIANKLIQLLRNGNITTMEYKLPKEFAKFEIVRGDSVKNEPMQ